MHGRPRLTSPLAVLALLLVAGVSAGCSHGVKVTLAPAAADPACGRLAAALPSTLLKQDRRDTEPSAPSVAAWGDPAIILRCGVTPPGPTTDQCIAVDGVDWVARPLGTGGADGYEFVTYGREPAVQVLVPRHYVPETFALTGLTAAVKAIRQGEHHCS